MSVIRGDQDPAPRMDGAAQARLECGDILGAEAYGRAGVRRPDLIVDGVEDRGDDIERGVGERGEQGLAAVREVALQEQLAAALAEGGAKETAR